MLIWVGRFTHELSIIWVSKKELSHNTSWHVNVDQCKFTGPQTLMDSHRREVMWCKYDKYMILREKERRQKRKENNKKYCSVRSYPLYTINIYIHIYIVYIYYTYKSGNESSQGILLLITGYYFIIIYSEEVLFSRWHFYFSTN